MRILGDIIRYLLNINTVWGLMILAAFGLCVAQHYLPTTTVIPAGAVREGLNMLTVRIRNSGDRAASFHFRLWLGPEGLDLPAEVKVRGEGRPWLISARPIDGGHLLKWDSDTPGKYEVVLNDKPIARGSLVTLQSMTDAAFDYAQKGFEICLGLVAAMVLFLGLMKVGEDAGVVQLVARVFHPIIRLLFPQVPRDHPANGAILMNMTTTILGLGNAATPFGLKAMEQLQDLNPHKGVASDSQVMLLAYNTAGFALLPTTLLALRKSAGCTDPFEIIGTCMIAGATSTIVAILAARLLGRLPMFSLKAALIEAQNEGCEPQPDAAVAESKKE